MKDFVKQRGQGLTEYIIILALVIIAVVGIAVTFGDDIRQAFEGSSASAPATTNVPAAPKDGSSAGTRPPSSPPQRNAGEDQGGGSRGTPAQ